MRAICEPSTIATPTPADGSYNGATGVDTETFRPWGIHLRTAPTPTPADDASVDADAYCLGVSIFAPAPTPSDDYSYITTITNAEDTD